MKSMFSFIVVFFLLQNLGFTQDNFIKLSKSEQFLQIAITSFKKDNVEVDLIGAVHIGEKAYYDELNELFKDYERVLYELVAEKNVIPEKKPLGESNPISAVQNGMKSFLDLESQLENIDYKKINFVHADLSPSKMKQKMTARGDSPLTIFLDSLEHIIRQQNIAAQKEDFDNEMQIQPDLDSILSLLEDSGNLKRSMAEQFISSDGMNSFGKLLIQFLIKDRNDAALKVMDSEIENGVTKIGIFYGAAHMPDFTEKLKSQGFVYQSQTWLNAWDLKKKSESSPIEKLIHSFTEQGIQNLNR